MELAATRQLRLAFEGKLAAAEAAVHHCDGVDKELDAGVEQVASRFQAICANLGLGSDRMHA